LKKELQSIIDSLEEILTTPNKQRKISALNSQIEEV